MKIHPLTELCVAAGVKLDSNASTHRPYFPLFFISGDKYKCAICGHKTQSMQNIKKHIDSHTPMEILALAIDMQEKIGILNENKE